MDFFFKGMNGDGSDCPFDMRDIQRCPFLRNIDEPTNFSFASTKFSIPVHGAKGPIFEDGPSFDMAFKLFHGKDGIVPLSERSDFHNGNKEADSMPVFNPLAARAASISLSSFGLGGPFNFGDFSEKWKKQKISESSNKKEYSSQKGEMSKHEALGNEWLENGNCPIAKSYRAASRVVPLVATALKPPTAMKFKCPAAVVAARAALARTAFVKNLRPQPLPAKMLAIAALGMALNVPLGLSNGESEPLLRRPLLSSQRSIINSTSQVAIVGANVCPIESLDYEIFENEFFKQDWRSRGVVQILQYICMKWLLCFMIGLIVGFIGFCNNLAVENLAGIKFVTTSNMMLERRFMFAFFIFFASNLSLTLFASIITAFIAPTAAGSGISEVKAYLNGVDAPGIFTVRTLCVKIIGSITAVSGSLVIGKAGPMVHTGACVAALLGQGGSKRYGITWRWLRFFKNDRDRRDLIICGSAAGIAAAFRAPVGGVLFALEEMASWWRTALLWRAFFTTATVAIFLRAMIDVCLSDKCGLFGKGGLIMFDAYSASISYHLVDVPPVFILAVVGGLLGSLFNFMTNKVLRIYNVINEKGTICRLFLACLISIFTSCLLFGLPWLAPCRPCPPDAVEPCPTIGRSGIYKKFQCPPNHYNGLASLIFNTNDDAIRNLFSMHTDNEFELSSMLVFFIICLFLSIFSCGIVAPAGLFVPIIVTGASYGRLVGILVGERTNLSNGLYAVLGAASLLGGSMRTTVSLCVIMLELTNNLLLLPLIMMVLVVSKSVANVFNANVYDLIMKAKGLPYLETHAEPYMRQLTVGDVVTGPLQMFNGIEKVRNIVFILRTTAHNGFPVIDEPPGSEAPILFGIILRHHLTTLLKKKAFLPSPVANSYDVVRKFSSDDFAKKYSVERVKIEDIRLTEEEMGMFVDLHPFTNASPYTVVETMSLAKALILFREVGLRHLLVIPKIPGRSPVVGILTRHDFTPEHILGMHPFLVKSRWKRLRFWQTFLEKILSGI